MFNFDEFKNYMVDLYDEDWLDAFRKNSTKIMQRYYTANGNDEVFEEYYSTFNANILEHIGVRIDPLSTKPAISYQSKLYITEASVLKLATALNAIVGISVDDIRIVLSDMLRTKKEQDEIAAVNSRNPMFDKSIFEQALGDILKHEGYVLDFELMDFKKIVGYDVNKNPIYSTITENVLYSVVEANENARALNMGVKPMVKEIMSYIAYYKECAKIKALGDIIEATKFNPKYAKFFPQFAKLVHETYNAAEPLDVFTIGLAQAYWNMKRLMRELPTYNDLTLSLRGAQGIGKGFIANVMFGTVLGKFYNPSAKISDIIDERWTPALGNMILINIDEADVGGGVGYLNEKAMAPLKSRITNNVFTYRPMHTNSTCEIRKKASFISTSNFHIYETMNDSSGMRRFLEFNSKNVNQQRFDEAKVAQIKEMAFIAFQSIDENRDRGYWNLESEIGKKITAIQETYVTKPAIVDFCEQLVVDTSMSFSDCMLLDDLYAEYEDYCTEQRVSEKYRIGKKNFRRKVEDIVEGCTKTRSNVHKFCVKSTKPEFVQMREVKEEQPDPVSAPYTRQINVPESPANDNNW